jgi:hypothetical protein
LSGATLSITPGGIYTFASNEQAIAGESESLMINPASLSATITSRLASLATPIILDASVQNVTCGNTADETTLFTFSVPAGTLSTANVLRITLIGTCLQNAGKGLFVYLKYGSTTVAGNAAASSYDNATTSNICINAYLAAQGATDSQFGTISSFRNFMSMNGAQGTSSEDSTGDLNLVITAKWSGASASATLTIKYVILEKITGV